MCNLIETLRQAKYSKTGVVAPLVFSVEVLRKIIIHAHELQQNVILRVDPSYIDVEDVIYWAKEYGQNYPCASTHIVVDKVKSFDEAIHYAAMAIDGIALDDSIQNATWIEELHMILGFAGIALQQTLTMEQALNVQETYADIIKINAVDLERCSVLPPERLYTCEDVEVTKENHKKIKALGISQFNVYANPSQRSAMQLKEMMKTPLDHGDRFLMFRIVDAILVPYCNAIKEQMYLLGQFILR